jgi:hypothetical protein
VRKIFGGTIAAIAITILSLILTWPSSVSAGASRPLGDEFSHQVITRFPHLSAVNPRPVTPARPAAAAAITLQVITVRPGDNLYKIAGLYLGSSSRWPNLWWSNRNLISDPSRIRGGQRLAVWRWQKGPVPAAIEAAAVRATGPVVVTVAAASPAPAPATSPPPPAAPAPSGDPQQYAAGQLGSYGWDQGQMGCLIPLWNQESGWRWDAANQSGAYGIPQALPGSKMASAGSDWLTNPDTQINWGLGYIKGTYGTPCGAWAHEQADGWY